MTLQSNTLVYKILSASDWQVASELGYSKTALDEGDGYVHLSKGEQVAETLRLHYAGQTGVQLLEYKLDSLGSDIRWEESRGGQLFPHLYGTLFIAKAVRQWALANDEAGNPVVPGEVAS
jgi:uncharacterized protein (DUF952 family)